MIAGRSNFIVATCFTLCFNFGHRSFAFAEVAAEADVNYTEAPKVYEFLPNAFIDAPHAISRVDFAEHWKFSLGLAALTGVLIHYDQEIIDRTQHFSHRIKFISEKDQGGGSKILYSQKILGIDVDFRIPDSPNSYFYYLGDGLTSISIAAGLGGSGMLASNFRMLHTASQIMESMVLTGFGVITLKYSFGRESPIKGTQPGGAWRPFPGIKNYLSNVSAHDAFPSGHIATAMSTVQILHLNYPLNPFILPIGYTSMSLLMFAMLNNGVHWASDYPLGITLGYIGATTVFQMRGPAKNEAASQRSSDKISYHFIPIILGKDVGFAANLQM